MSSIDFSRPSAMPQNEPTLTRKTRLPAWQSVVSALVMVLAVTVLFRVLLVPDPAGDLLFRRALRLESQNLIGPALRQYRLLSDSHPNSPHAPEALWHQGELLLQLARAGDAPRFQEALAAYSRLADGYRQSETAGRALLRIGALSMEELQNPKVAKAVYERVLREYPNNRDFASEATLRLGRVAMLSRDGKGAQRWLQLVTRSYPSLYERCAEAQYLLGETYETQFRDRLHMVWARNAYELTITKYPKSVWAARAKERRASLIYGEVAPLARRVLIAVAPMPDEGSSNGSLFSALHSVMAARGIEADDITLAGWGLEPFYAGFSPDDPSRVVSAPFNAFDNAVAGAGLAYEDVETGSDPKIALKVLQDEIDDARVVLVYTGRWSLVTGYDSGRNRVFIQDRGARRVSVSSADFVKAWKKPSPRGTAFTLLSFHAPGEVAKLQANVIIAPNQIVPGSMPSDVSVPKGGLSKTGAIKRDGAVALPTSLPAALQQNASGRARVSSLISPLQPPTLLYTLNPLPERAAYRFALLRAVAKMQKPSQGKILLNVAALRSLGAQMNRLAVAPSIEDAQENAGEPVAPLENEPPVRSESGAATNASPDVAMSETPDSETATGDAIEGDAIEGAVDPVASPDGAPPVVPVKKTAPVGAGIKAGTIKIGRAAGKANEALKRARALLGWRGAPLSHWIAARRQAAGFLDRAAVRLKEPSLREAAAAFRQSVAALENARAALPASDALTSGSRALSPAARRAFALAASEIERAANVEARATDIMSRAAA